MPQPVPTLGDQIADQRDCVELALQAWQRVDPDAETAAWETYQAELAKLDALCKYAKVGVITQ